MTKDVINLFGYDIELANDNKINLIPHTLPSEYRTPNTEHLQYTCEPDYSSVGYYWFYSYLLRKRVFIPKMKCVFQPDYYFIDILKDLGIRFIEDESYISIDITSLCNGYKGGWLAKQSIDMSEMPDQIITLSFMALFIEDSISITGCETLRLKESDRIAGIIENITILGGQAIFHDGVLTIHPLGKLPNRCILKTYNDHRFALTFTVLKSKFPYLEIDNINCINKSISFHKSKPDD